MRIYNADLAAANEVLKRAQDTGVAAAYVKKCITMENSGDCWPIMENAGNPLSVIERVKIIDSLEAEKEENRE